MLLRVLCCFVLAGERCFWDWLRSVCPVHQQRSRAVPHWLKPLATEERGHATAGLHFLSLASIRASLPAGRGAQLVLAKYIDRVARL